MRTREIVQSWDPVLCATMFLLVSVGLAMLFSATYTSHAVWSGRFGRQLIAIALSTAVFWMVLRMPYHSWRRWAWFIYGIGLAGLGLVAVTARVIRGAASRLAILDFQLQPSEFMKIGVVVLLAAFLAPRLRMGWKTFLTSFLLIALPVALIVSEPDIGNAFLLMVSWVGLLVFLGLPWRSLASLAALGAIGLAGSWQWLLVEYQKKRILTFLDPTRDPLGAGYNVVQSIIALGSGGLVGRGLGHGPQSQLQFLPERHTDFILASIGEELGFVGVGVVLALYALLLWRILRTARSTQDPFGRLLCVGVFWILCVSFVVTAGMNMGLLPVTGIPLPLVSYGGSSLLATFVLLGMVQSVRIHSKWKTAPPPELTHF